MALGIDDRDQCAGVGMHFDKSTSTKPRQQAKRRKARTPPTTLRAEVGQHALVTLLTCAITSRAPTCSTFATPSANSDVRRRLASIRLERSVVGARFRSRRMYATYSTSNCCTGVMAW